MSYTERLFGTERAKLYCGIFIAFFALFMFCAGLDRKPLQDPDEPRVAGIAAEMARSGDFISPKLNGSPFLEIPPLYWWSSAAIFDIAGEGEAQARMVSGISAALCVIAVYLLALRGGWSLETAFLAAIMLASAPQFWSIGRRCIMDMLLCLCVTAAIFFFYSFRRSLESGSFKAYIYVCFYSLALAGALMTKGLIGFGIACSGLFFWLLLTRCRSWKIWLLLFAGAGFAFIPLAIWSYMLYLKDGREAVYVVLVLNNLGRFSGDHQEHLEPFYYYLTKFPLQFLPWTLPLLAAFYLVWTDKKVFFRGESNSLFSLVLTAFLVPFLILSVASGKRPIYLLPLYPMAALASAWALAHFLDRFGKLQYIRRFLVPLSCLSLAVFLTVDMIVLPLKAGEKSYETAFREFSKITGKEAETVLYNPIERHRGAAVFYLGHNLPELEKKELEQYLSKPGLSWLIARDESEGELTALEKVKSIKVTRKSSLILFKKKDGN